MSYQVILSRDVGQMNVVCPHLAEAREDLGEWRHDVVLQMAEKERIDTLQREDSKDLFLEVVCLFGQVTHCFIWPWLAWVIGVLILSLFPYKDSGI